MTRQVRHTLSVSYNADTKVVGLAERKSMRHEQLSEVFARVAAVILDCADADTPPFESTFGAAHLAVPVIGRLRSVPCANP
jgi:hypothetical protein